MSNITVKDLQKAIRAYKHAINRPPLSAKKSILMKFVNEHNIKVTPTGKPKSNHKKIDSEISIKKNIKTTSAPKKKNWKEME